MGYPMTPSTPHSHRARTTQRCPTAQSEVSRLAGLLPFFALATAGVPATIAETLLQTLAVPDEVLAKLPDVVAHQHEQLSLEARLLILLLDSAAIIEKLRSVSPGA